MRVAAIGLVLLLAVWPRPVAADHRFDRISKTVRELIHEQELPSITIAVAQDGRILWEEGFGWADREQQSPATPYTPYSLASISKPFTATAVMNLVEAGRLALDRQANDYLGDARIAGPHAAKATIRRILSHTAGLPPFFRTFLANDSLPIEEIITRHAVLSSPPGKRHVYSNLGYGILEHIIARVSGVSYEEFMRREVFAPLRLDNASVPRVAPTHAAVRYDPGNRALPFYDVGHRGASAIYASAHDLVRFGMFHLKRLADGSPVLKGKSIDEMQRVQTPESPTDGYGLGWRIDSDDSGFRHIGHTGGMPGVTTVLSLFPAERVVIVVLANKQSDVVVRLGEKLAATVMPHYGWRLRDARRPGDE